MTSADQDHLLAEIRRDIDDVDSRLVDLLLRRFAASAQVRVIKRGSGEMSTTPYRPAREAEIMRRLMKRVDGRIPADVLVRLWRVILSASINAQAAVTIHMVAADGADITSRVHVDNHFCGMPVQLHDSLPGLLSVLQSNPMDLGLLKPRGAWVDSLIKHGRGCRVVGGLPFLIGNLPPDLLVLSSAPPQASGHDLTLLLSNGPIPTAARVSSIWQQTSGERTVTAVAGFLNEGDGTFAELQQAHPDLQLCILGAIPSLVENKS